MACLFANYEKRNLVSIKFNCKMYYYLVIDDGEPYDILFTSYEQAVATVKIRHRETIETDAVFAEKGGYGRACEVDVPENPSGKTELYIEKGIYIYIHRFKV